jgi:hypothetical protein
VYTGWPEVRVFEGVEGLQNAKGEATDLGQPAARCLRPGKSRNIVESKDSRFSKVLDGLAWCNDLP